jgi:hypothetical protein
LQSAPISTFLLVEIGSGDGDFFYTEVYFPTTKHKCRLYNYTRKASKE